MGRQFSPAVEVETPEGSRIERQVVRHPGAVSIVPLLEDQTVAMVRQYRAAVDVALLELPAGTRDVPGEEAIETAHRELREEAGMSASSMTLLSDFYNSPGSSDHHHLVFLAEGLTHGERDAQGEEEEHMTTEYVRLSEVPELIASGFIKDAKSIIGLLLTRD